MAGMLGTEDLERNWLRLQERVAAAAVRAGRTLSDVRIMAVTKLQPTAVIRLALGCGITLIGENRVQEAESKFCESEDCIPVGAGGLELHLIGHLQRNKAARAARLFGCVQSVDKVETARKLAQGLASGRTMDVMLEFNTSGEESKFGYLDESRLLEELAMMAEIQGLRVRGLMTIAPFTDQEAPVRKAFARLRELYARARAVGPEVDTLSMGMSADYEIAVEEGATMVRVGTALFGARDHG